MANTLVAPVVSVGVPVGYFDYTSCGDRDTWGVDSGATNTVHIWDTRWRFRLKLHHQG